MLLGKPFFDHGGAGVKQERVEQFWVGFCQRSQLSWEREDDMMMFEFGQLAQDRRRPVIGFVLTTPGTKAILTRVIDKLGRAAPGTFVPIFRYPSLRIRGHRETPP